MLLYSGYGNCTKLSLADGVLLRPCCLEPCILSCFWGCEVSALQGTLQAHQHGLRLSTPHHFQEALKLHYRHCQSFQYPYRTKKGYKKTELSDCNLSAFQANSVFLIS